ncbi:MAG: hypothetical protein GY756_05080, partial [bacterium]|nr:hypothetical protein [bacterium]
MIDNIINEIAKLTQSLDLIDQNQAKNIIDASVNRITDEIGAHICDIFTTNAASEGFDTPKPYLESFFTIDKANRNRS